MVRGLEVRTNILLQSETFGIALTMNLHRISEFALHNFKRPKAFTFLEFRN